MKTFIMLFCFVFLYHGLQLNAQINGNYWNHQTSLLPKRMPLPDNPELIKRIDLDGDGDPDVMFYTIMNGIPVMWIDDQNNMKWTDLEGDMAGGCLCIDRNKDGIFAGPEDICIDFIDFENDEKANMMWLVEWGKDDVRGLDWNISHIMAFIDEDQKGVFNYIDWNLMAMRHWERIGHSNFLTGYKGNTTFTKVCTNTNRLSDLRYSWENPFIFWDVDHDGLSEVALRMLDIPEIRENVEDPNFKDEKSEVDVRFTKQISYVAITYDMDNDNGQGNEFDFDMTLCFEGEGFAYDDQVNKFKNMKGLPEANQYLYDSSWRMIDELIFPNRETAIDLTYNRGKWESCRFVFDEDDDCNRWERVELYDPKNVFASGVRRGGLDNNPQADEVGDRGEFDMDFSGKGNLYVGGFDGKTHLYGAEWGAWRIDQTAYSFQGYGGLYEHWDNNRIQYALNKFATIKYTDTDNNGFFDLIEYDLDGDTIFEKIVSLKALGIDDRQTVIETKGMDYWDYNSLFKTITEKNWERAQQAISIAENRGVSTGWYAFWKNPLTLFEKYQYAYWLNFYIYMDLRHLAKSKGDLQLVTQIDRAYYSGDWELINSKQKRRRNEQ
jgi:hypothetical protein